MKFATLLLISAVSAIRLSEDPAANTTAPAVTTPTVTSAPTPVFKERPAEGPAAADINGGFQAGVPFQLHSKQEGNKVMFIDPHPYMEALDVTSPDLLTDKRAVKIRDSQHGAGNQAGEWWVFHAPTQSIRSYMNFDFVLSVEGGSKVVTHVKPTDKKTKLDASEQQIYTKGNFHFKSATVNSCFEATGNEDDSDVVAKDCDDKAKSQMWYPAYNW